VRMARKLALGAGFFCTRLLPPCVRHRDRGPALPAHHRNVVVPTVTVNIARNDHGAARLRPPWEVDDVVIGGREGASALPIGDWDRRPFGSAHHRNVVDPAVSIEVARDDFGAALRRPTSKIWDRLVGDCDTAGALAKAALAIGDCDRPLIGSAHHRNVIELAVAIEVAQDDSRAALHRKIQPKAGGIEIASALAKGDDKP